MTIPFYIGYNRSLDPSTYIFGSGIRPSTCCTHQNVFFSLMKSYDMLFFPVTWRIEAIGGWDDGSMFQRQYHGFFAGNPWTAEMIRMGIHPYHILHVWNIYLHLPYMEHMGMTSWNAGSVGLSIKFKPMSVCCHPTIFWNISELVKILPTHRGCCLLPLHIRVLFWPKTWCSNKRTSTYPQVLLSQWCCFFPVKKGYVKKTSFPWKEILVVDTPLKKVFSWDVLGVWCSSMGKFRWAQQPVVCWWRLPGPR